MLLTNCFGKQCRLRSDYNCYTILAFLSAVGLSSPIVVTLMLVWVSHFKVLRQSLYAIGKDLSGELS